MSSEFIDDPEGIIVFEKPTQVDVHYGSAEHTTEITVLPYSSQRDERTFWAGADTYTIPEDVEYTHITELTVEDGEIDVTADTRSA